MVKMVHRPLKEIVVLECVQSTKAQMIEFAATAVRTGTAGVALRWTKGVLFIHSGVDPSSTDSLLDQYINEGRIYWASVQYALMPEFEPMVKSRTIEVPVLDVSSNTALCDAAIWLKKRATEESSINR